MNKLGFAIKFAHEGVYMPIVCNSGQWTNKVVDIRDFLKLFTGLAYNEQGHQVSTGNSATFISFDEGGCFLVLFKAISGRFGDFLSGWIYIPNTIEATGEDIINTYNYVRNILSQSNLTEYKDDIESFFSKEYPAKEITAIYTPSKGHLFGIRYLGHYSLKEIVGDHRYQPYYSNYKATFLLEKVGEVEVAKDSANIFHDLTDKDIVKTAILIPPTSLSLQKLGRGTELLTQDGAGFTSPLLVNVGTTVPFLLTRDGFENIRIDVSVVSEKQDVDLTNVEIVWKKKITPSMFNIVNYNGDNIKSAQIIVNGVDITYQEALFSEIDCELATVEVIAPNYESNEKKCSLLTDNIKISLRRKIETSRMKIVLANGELADMTLECSGFSDKSNSPLAGYEYSNNYGIGDKKILSISSRYVWKQRLWGFFASLGIILLFIALAAFDTWSDTHHFKFGLPPWEKNRPVQQSTLVFSEDNNDSTQNQTATEVETELESTELFSLDSAINYLDKQTIWTKSELNKYPDLQGLFDDMNTFNLSRLLNDWHMKLETSKNFQKVYESANKCFIHHWNPKQGAHYPTYNKPNDEQIVISNYINWLGQDQTPELSSEGGFHPNVNTHGQKNANKAGSSTTKPQAPSVKPVNSKGETTKNGGL
ncbi:hypothetical protein [Xylanibacter ruminicola]|uniref:Uncharacterized protein n=1 Tax=Xylanibacter ruminicola TaxID=839 RepID=A0A1M6VGH9_XYLRU|nr:hypothetical protein [Xylanibacter ruminicola]SHK80647.1 hypothetical protein SAMN05216463_112114 [Xylanibacter ruminicola]